MPRQFIPPSLLRPLEFLKKVKFGGVVGKKTVIAVVAFLILGVAIVVLRNTVWAVLVALAILLLIFFWVLHSIDKTVAVNPDLALLDGVEIVAIRTAEIAARNYPALPDSPTSNDPAPPPIIEAPAENEE